MTPAVSILHTYKSFGSEQALIDIDFEIEDGSFFGLLGPNGAGKSTIINIMAGLTRADKGEVKVMGNDVWRHWRKTRRALGVVPQELAYDWFFSAREMLRLQSGYFGYGRSRYKWVDELLEKLGLIEKADESLYHLSGGMKRRVMIAQALVHKPRIVVLDEPTAGVDVELRKVLWEFVKQLHKKGHTILLTTHYLEEAEALCDKIAILDNGKVIAHDTTEALLGRYPFRLLYLKLKEESCNLPEQIQEKAVSFEKNNLVLRIHRERDHIADILDMLNSAGIRFRDLRTEEPGLEEVFIALTGKNND